MIRTRGPPTRIVCKAYSAPIGTGAGVYLMSFDPGTLLGPVEEVRWHEELGYLTVRVGDYWINVYCRNGRRGVHFAYAE